MSVTSFGYSARLQVQAPPELWVRIAGALFSLGLAVGLLGWWNGTLDPHEAPKQFLLAITMMLVIPLLLLAFRRGMVHRPFAWATVGSLGALLGSALISWILAPDQWLAFYGVAGSVSTSVFTLLIAISAFGIAGTLALAGWQPSTTVAYSVVSFGTLVTTMQRLGWIDISSGGLAARVFSPLGNASALGWLVGCVVIYALAQELFIEAPSFAEKVARRIFLVVAMVWLLGVDQQALWILLLLGAASIFGASSLFSSEKVSYERYVALGVVGAISLVGLALPIPLFSGGPNLVALSWQQSLRTVQVAWSQKGYWFGAGQGQWFSVFESIRPVALNLGSFFNIRFDTGGAYWWTLLLQQGIVGGLAWVLFILFASIKTALHVRAHEERLPLAIAAWIGLGTFFFMQPHSWGIVLLFASFGYLLADRHEAGRAATVSWLISLGVLGLVLLLALPNAVQRLRADRLLWSAQQTNNSQERLQRVRQAQAATPWLAETAFVAIQAANADLQDRLKQGVQDPAVFQQDLATAIEEAKKDTARWPTDPALWLARGSLYATIAPVTNGADQFAIQAYQQGLAYAPHHPGFATGIAQIFLQRAELLGRQAGEADKAQAETLAKARLEQLRLASEWLKRALDQKPDDRTTRYVYASTLARSGSIVESLPWFDGLWKEDPTRADIALEYATVLAAAGRTADAIKLVETIGSQERVYLDSRRLVVGWYEKEKRYSEAIAALRSFPLSEQQTQAFRQQLNRLQSESNASSHR